MPAHNETLAAAAVRVGNKDGSLPSRSTVATQPHDQPALLRLVAAAMRRRRLMGSPGRSKGHDALDAE